MNIPMHRLPGVYWRMLESRSPASNPRRYWRKAEKEREKERLQGTWSHSWSTSINRRCPSGGWHMVPIVSSNKPNKRFYLGLLIKQQFFLPSTPIHSGLPFTGPGGIARRRLTESSSKATNFVATMTLGHNQSYDHEDKIQRTYSTIPLDVLADKRLKSVILIQTCGTQPPHAPAPDSVCSCKPIRATTSALRLRQRL